MRLRRRSTDAAVERGGLSRNWPLIPRAFRYLRPYRRRGAGSLALTIALALVALAEPWPLAFVVDTVLHDDLAPGWATAIVGDGKQSLIVLGAAGMMLLALVTGALTLAHEYVTTSLDLRMVLDLRSELFRHMLRLPPSFHEDRQTGGLMYRVNDEADSLGKVVLAFPDLLQSGLTLIGMLVIAVRIDVPLALLSVSVVPFVVASTRFYANRIETSIRATRRLELATFSIVHEALTMVRVIVAFGRESYEYGRFRDKGEQAVDARVKLTIREAVFRLAVSLITAIGTSAVLGFGAYRVVTGHITTGELLVMLSYVAAVYGPLRLLTNTVTSLQQRLMALRSMFSLLDTPPQVVERPGAARIGRSTGRLTVDDVSFSYPTRSDTLRSISFSIDPGQAIALVGPTGAGKSTLVSLLPRHYDVAAGRIAIDGVDVRDITLESLRAQFSIVLQEPLLFPDTVRANIAYGKPGASQQEIERAAIDANAHSFICGLPDKYDTVLGEGGAKVSGGERQRISIARAFLRDAPILILDEPTSSIDSRTETAIVEALERLMQGRTTILIAHRLSTIRSVDRILVLNEGSLVESGTHGELIQRDGVYRQLWEAQAMQLEKVRAARRAIGQVGAEPVAR